ncbi:MAG: 2-amino-4-hydroxy-6-hydroxymethyldihydropteridine diphosphokinase [Omnitrophica bacterium RIFCSPLOWO2_01_FULL_45_10]|nr:MAG: 2-amino-4-hydroxy-6-hydroxymethyldihydropteridine diphosphokinase [Omnitrophica bacterium RIFCSPLOWO2_01_FULL_45_10]
MVTICYIGIGTNLGDRRANIDKAIQELKKNKNINFKRSSSVYETEAQSDIPQGKFLNGVLEIETDLDPKELLNELNRIEKKLGRKRIVKDGPRAIDLDILYYGDRVIKEPDLAVPHPKINEREFVLKGLRELGRA